MGHKLDEIVAFVFIDMAVILVVARLMGMLFRRLRQPAVIGEILAGIALGPSLLGLLPGDLPGVIFPTDVRPFLTVVAQLGLIIFMFIVGLELDLTLVRGKERLAATVSLSSVALPFGLGLLLAVLLYREHSDVGGEEVEFLPFALFIGASMSVTAFPVLARILTERGMHRTQIGVLALACAAVDDVLAWSILAVVLAVAESQSPLDLPILLAESVAFVVVMFRVVRPQLRRLVSGYQTAGRLTPNLLSVVLVGVLVSSFVTHAIGIHVIFGAFVFGVIMPREGAAALLHEILERLEQVSVLLLLPVFFIATGLNVDITGLGSAGLVELLAVLAVAITGKFVGAAAAARVMGIRARRASAIGVLMNTRGLTELIILNIGLSIGVLDQELFTILVVMAIVTTVMTEPLLRLVYPDRLIARDIAEAERAALGADAAFRVVVVVDAAPTSGHLVDAGVGLMGRESPSELVLSCFERPVKKVEVGAGLTSELAQIAASFESLQELVQRARAQEAAAVVRTQYSDDPGRDLVAHVVAIGAQSVVVDLTDPTSERLATADRLVQGADCSVVLVVGTPVSTPVVRVSVVVGSGSDADAVVEHAVRLAQRYGAEISVVDPGGRRDGRRASALVTRLQEAGIDARLDRPDGSGTAASPPTSLLLVALDAERGGRALAQAVTAQAHPGAVWLVHGARDQQDGRLATLLEQTARRPSRAAT